MSSDGFDFKKRRTGMADPRASMTRDQILTHAYNALNREQRRKFDSMVRGGIGRETAILRTSFDRSIDKFLSKSK